MRRAAEAWRISGDGLIPVLAVTAACFLLGGLVGCLLASHIGGGEMCIRDSSDYEGKTVFLNFWATWCGPCKREMPEVQALYEKYGNNEGDVIVLGVANPKSEEYPYNQDVTQPEVEQFLEDGGYTFPVVMDVTGEVFYSYGISAFPTTFMIGADGNVFGYVPGALTGDMMESIVQQTIDGVEAGA